MLLICATLKYYAGSVQLVKIMTSISFIYQFSYKSIVQYLSNFTFS